MEQNGKYQYLLFNFSVMIRIFIIEDHNVTVAGLRTFFRSTRDPISIVAAAPDIEQALLTHSGIFDVIFLDLWLPQGDPTQNFTKVAAHFPGKPIIIYTGEKSIHWQRKMYKLGAKGFVNKQADRAEIRDVLERVINGETVYTPIMREYHARRDIESYKNPVYGLTPEQQTVASLFIEGLSPKEIGKKIGRDLSSVNRRMRQIRKIFEASNNIDLLKIIFLLDKNQPPDSNRHSKIK